MAKSPLDGQWMRYIADFQANLVIQNRMGTESAPHWAFQIIWVDARVLPLRTGSRVKRIQAFTTITSEADPIL